MQFVATYGIMKVGDHAQGGESMKIEVMCLNTGERFGSITEAAASAGVDKSVMSKHLNGKLKSAGGKAYMKINPNETPNQIEAHRRARFAELYDILII